MIYVRLKGGLGNQMFQYAAALRLAKKHGTGLALDVHGFGRDKLRQYALEAFQISGRRLLPPSPWQTGRFLRRLLRRRKTLTDGSRPPEFNEVGDGLLYDFRTLALGDGICLNGFFQSERYFADIQEQVRQEFRLNVPLPAEAEKLRQQIESVPAVSVHIRRTDYLHDPFLFPQPVDYFERAAERLRAQVADPHFFVFSDDPEWAAAHLQLPGARTFVTGFREYQGVFDLWLMSRCRHNIIANSTFSWWAAWLNPHPGKQVFAPQQWFRCPSLDNADRIPAAWQRI